VSFVLQTPLDNLPVKVKNDNPLAQQKIVTTTPNSSPVIKKPVRKAPPPPVLSNKTSQPATQANGDTSGECKQVESDLPPKSPATFKHKIAETLLHWQQVQQQPLPLEQQYQQQQPVNVRCLNKSSSCYEIANSQGRKGPPPPPVRDSSLSAESYDEHNDDKGDDRVFSSQDPKQARASKPVPKRRTKSVHH